MIAHALIQSIDTARAVTSRALRAALVGPCRCNRCGLATETNDEGWGACCWTVDETDEVMQGLAIDVAMGHASPDDIEDEVCAILGRDLTGEESERLAENLAEARRQVAAMRRAGAPS